MRSTLVLSVLAALLVASVSIAAKPQSGTAQIDQLGASGISGTATLKADPSGSGDVRVHEQITGLTPGAEYVSAVYLSAATCGLGVRVEIMTFTANNAGKANFNVVVPPQGVPAIVGGAFLSIEQAGPPLSCGEIIPEL